MDKFINDVWLWSYSCLQLINIIEFRMMKNHSRKTKAHKISPILMAHSLKSMIWFVLVTKSWYSTLLLREFNAELSTVTK